jgi:hypothetical protein
VSVHPTVHKIRTSGMFFPNDNHSEAGRSYFVSENERKIVKKTSLEI